MTRIWNAKGFTAIETVLAVAIFSIVGLMIGDIFTRANRLAENSRQAERAAALGEMVLEQYNAYAARRYDRLPSYDCTRVDPSEFFGGTGDLGYSHLSLTTRAQPSRDGSMTTVTVTVAWGNRVLSPGLTFTKIYANRMSGDDDNDAHDL